MSGSCATPNCNIHQFNNFRVRKVCEVRNPKLENSAVIFDFFEFWDRELHLSYFFVNRLIEKSF
jgi:hypothetical protein